MDVADRVQACTLYVHDIFPGRNFDHRELEFRKRHGGCEIEEGIHDADSKSKGQDILSVLPAITSLVHMHTACRVGQRTIYMKTANSAFQHDLIRHGHGTRYARTVGTRVQSIRD